MQEQKASLPGLRALDVASMPREALRQRALERLFSNLRAGAEGSEKLKTGLARVSFNELLNFHRTATEAPPSREDVKRVFPGAPDEVVEEALREALAELAKVGKGCGGDEVCVRKARMESQSESVELLTQEANTQDEELLKKLEALGHGSIRVPGNATASGAALLELLDGDMEGKAAVELKGRTAALLSLALIAGLGFVCGPAHAFCHAFFVVIWVMVALGYDRHRRKKMLAQRREFLEAALESAKRAEEPEGQ